MTPEETVVLTRYVKALCPQQKFDEFTPDAWHDVLTAWPMAEARAAAAAVAGRQPFVSPAEIIGEIWRQRGNRAADFQGPGLPAEVPDADPDNVHAYLAALRAQRTKAADGIPLRRRPIAQFIAGLTDALPDMPGEEVAEVKRPGPLGVACPVCRAAIGRPCAVDVPGSRGSRKELHTPHAARTRVANGGPAQLESPEVIEQRRAASLAKLAELNGREGVK
ncbi:hypothetical protein ACFYM2_21320 [Streptomyces sp. NPDC006711]|uniref:zinc finger domain-containing protein n=1 Tax=Streptomyces sp. NPDC006711 TaxID=3364762 RepID=UPI0036B631AD